ncbi:hypothetical protein F9K50_00285 [bacterium]|nr:MAG: hypothetical protein F9K50_00285 [bacterium]
MGRVTLTGPDGNVRASAFYGASSGESASDNSIADDGVITDLEISVAREHLEEEINRSECGYGGPVGLGGWGGINEVCVQPHNMGGPARENTPDGYSMPVTVRLREEYSEPTGILFFRNYRSVERDVTMTARWESGRVRLYQGAMPAYSSPPPPPPPPDIGAELAAGARAIGEGIHDFFVGAESIASSTLESLRRAFA